MIQFNPDIRDNIRYRLLENFYGYYCDFVRLRKERKFTRKQFKRSKMRIQKAMVSIIQVQNTMDKEILTERLNEIRTRYGYAFTAHMRKKIIEDFLLYMGAALLADALINYKPGEYDEKIKVEYPESTTEIIG